MIAVCLFGRNIERVTDTYDVQNSIYVCTCKNQDVSLSYKIVGSFKQWDKINGGQLIPVRNHFDAQIRSSLGVALE